MTRQAFWRHEEDHGVVYGYIALYVWVTSKPMGNILDNND